MFISVLIMGSPGFECVHIDLWVGWFHRVFNPGSTSSLLLSSVPGNLGSTGLLCDWLGRFLGPRGYQQAFSAPFAPFVLARLVRTYSSGSPIVDTAVFAPAHLNTSIPFELRVSLSMAHFEPNKSCNHEPITSYI